MKDGIAATALRIFAESLSYDEPQRARFIDKVCAGDDDLRREVVRLLTAHNANEKDGFLRSLPMATVHTMLQECLTGQTIGLYHIEELLGEGGESEVYRAKQDKPIRRHVAFKVLKRGMDSRQFSIRFEVERDALARMNHPHVAKVFDAGRTERGRPYFVMEQVLGAPITKYCDEHRLNIDERLRLFIDVCHGVQHAHQKEIIHRDLKPSNILVTEHGERPVPRIIDFGIARATESRPDSGARLTEVGQLLGTPGYMSPEQVEMDGPDIDTRTDIFSLGAVLYELLVGKHPFDTEAFRHASIFEKARIIKECEPSKPSANISRTRPRIDTVAHDRRIDPKSLARKLTGDIDWIVMKCLERDRNRRYDTPNDLSADIQRFLNTEPVLARPYSVGYCLGKFVRKNKALVFSFGAGLVFLIVALVVATTGYLVASAAHRHSEATSDFVSRVLTGAGPSAALGRDTALLKERLDDAAERIRKGSLTHASTVELELRRTIGVTYREIGRYEQAKEILQPAVELAQSLYGREHIEVATTLHEFGTVLAHLGRYSSAIEIERNALAMRRRLLGDKHSDVATSLDDLAGVLERDGQLVEAEEFCRAGLKMRQELLGDENELVGSSLTNLSVILVRRNNYSEAKECNHKALEILRTRFGSVHPTLVHVLNNTGEQLRASGKYSEAEAVLRESTEMRRKLLGNDHTSMALALNNLAKAVEAQGRYNEAAKLFRTSLAICETVPDDGHPQLAHSLRGLAQVLVRLGKYNEAETIARRALDVNRARLGEHHMETARSQETLGTALEFLGKHEEAEALYRKSVALLRESLGPSHSEIAGCLGKLGGVLAEQNKYAEAEVALAEALSMRQVLLGEGHPDTLAIQIMIAGINVLQGKYAEAELLYREVREKLCRSLSEDHPNVVTIDHNLAVVLSRQKKWTDAEELYRKCLNRDRRQLPEEHPDIATGLNNLSRAVFRQGRVEEAEQLAREALVIRRKALGNDHPDVANSLNMLGSILNHRGNYEEAELLLRECRTICEAKLPRGDLLHVHASSVLGAVLTFNGRFADAEKVLMEEYEALKDVNGDDSRRRLIIDEIVKLYDSWDVAQPEAGLRAKAADWQTIRDGLDLDPSARR